MAGGGAAEKMLKSGAEELQVHHLRLRTNRNDTQHICPAQRLANSLVGLFCGSWIEGLVLRLCGTAQGELLHSSCCKLAPAPSYSGRLHRCRDAPVGAKPSLEHFRAFASAGASCRICQLRPWVRGLLLGHRCREPRRARRQLQATPRPPPVLSSKPWVPTAQALAGLEVEGRMREPPKSSLQA